MAIHNVGNVEMAGMSDQLRNVSFCGRTRREFFWQAGMGFPSLGLIDLLSRDGAFAKPSRADGTPGGYLIEFSDSSLDEPLDGGQRYLAFLNEDSGADSEVLITERA